MKKRRFIKVVASVLLLVTMSLYTTVFAVEPTNNTLKNIPVDNQVASSTAIEPLAAYTLKDSTFYSQPTGYRLYNCYAFALGRTSGANIGQFSGNSFSGSPISIVSELADYVVADLKSTTFNKKCVLKSTAMPNSVPSGSELICLRCGTSDYHFMKKVGNVWRHKTGGKAILTYKYSPSTSRVWTNEWVENSVAHAGNTTYTSTIYYFLYRSSHITTRKYTGSNYHKGTLHYYQYGDVCSQCGNVSNTSYVKRACSGPPCSAPYSIDLPAEAA